VLTSAGETRAHKLLDITALRQFESCTPKDPKGTPSGQYKVIVKWTLSAA
jgi:hypothetical protein